MINENHQKRKERCILAGALLPNGVYNPDDPLDEIRGLAETAGLTVLASLMQKRPYVDVTTYLGKGKVEELKNLVEAHEADLVVFDNDLAPSQTRNPTFRSSWPSLNMPCHA